MWRRPIARARERMVLGQVRPGLEDDEPVLVWTHVLATDDARPGLLSLTPSRCLVHFTTREEATTALRWDELTAWRVDPSSGDGVRLRLTSQDISIALDLPLTTPARAVRTTGVVEHLARLAPHAAHRDMRPTPAFEPEPRGVRGHARRVVVTVVGMLVMLVGLVLASPGVPGPGALVFLAGLAVLSREYDWARDVHRWVKRTAERGLAEVRRRRAARRGGRTGEVTPVRSSRDEPGAVPGVTPRTADPGVTDAGVTEAGVTDAGVTPDLRAG